MTLIGFKRIQSSSILFGFESIHSILLYRLVKTPTRHASSARSWLPVDTRELCRRVSLTLSLASKSADAPWFTDVGKFSVTVLLGSGTGRGGWVLPSQTARRVTVSSARQCSPSPHPSARPTTGRTQDSRYGDPISLTRNLPVSPKSKISATLSHTAPPLTTLCSEYGEGSTGRYDER